MRAKQRYLIVAGAVLTLLGLWRIFGDSEDPSQHGHIGLFSWAPAALDAPSFMGQDDFRFDQDLTLSARHRREVHSRSVQKKKCTMETCFDFSLCRCVASSCFITFALQKTPFVQQETKTAVCFEGGNLSE